MIRRLSTKWVLAVLASVVVPFVGFAWYVDVELADRLSNEVVRDYLVRFAADLADRIDDELAERRLDVELLASDPLVLASARGTGAGRASMLEASLERIVRHSPGFDLFLVVGADGRCIAAATVEQGSLEVTHRLRELNYSDREWFRAGLNGNSDLVDQHISPLLHPQAPGFPSQVPGTEGLDLTDPRIYCVGISAPIREVNGDQAVLGVVYALLNWRVFQEDLLDESRGAQISAGIGSAVYSSSYSWLWKSDANTIIGHNRTSLYGKLVSEPPVDLPQLVAAARATSWGMFPEYEFGGVMKQAAFKHCKKRTQGGLGWVVGIGVDNTDIFATVNKLHQLLVKATALVLLLVVAWTVIIARRTTQPILALHAHTLAVASGDLETRIEVHSGDELGDLARAFNLMTEELSQNRTRLVQAEKESAWREMARQVAHEIKNPLTPISLSVNLLRRARDEDSPEFDAILDRTVELIQRQVENLRQIAQDFYAFAGDRRLEPRPTDLRSLVEEIMDLNAAWAQELGVTVRVEGSAPELSLDPTEFRRVLINLTSNALEAMSDGGELVVSIEDNSKETTIVVSDTGVGLTEEVRQRLFEPYFTTRSHGTGLGLAICKRVIDEMGGELSLTPAGNGGQSGTRAEIRLPKPVA